MSQDPVVQALVAAINQNTQWVGQTTRELRDKVEAQAKETAALRTAHDKNVAEVIKSVETSVNVLSNDVGSLTSAIKSSSDSSQVLSTRMFWLTIILAGAAIAQAVAAYLQIRK